MRGSEAAFGVGYTSPVTGRSSADYPSAYTGVTRSDSTGWVAWLLFAAVMLVMLGAFQATLGLVALFHNGFFLVHRNGEVIKLNYTTWGWIHLVLALIALATGIGLMLGQGWARISGIVLCVLNVVVMFAFFPAYPLLAVLLLVFSIITMYAIIVHGREVADAYDS